MGKHIKEIKVITADNTSTIKSCTSNTVLKEDIEYSIEYSIQLQVYSTVIQLQVQI